MSSAQNTNTWGHSWKLALWVSHELKQWNETCIAMTAIYKMNSTYLMSCNFCTSVRCMWRRRDPCRRLSSSFSIALCSVILGLRRRRELLDAAPDSPCLGQCILHTTHRLSFYSAKFRVHWLVETGFPETRLVNQREAANHVPYCCLGDSRLDLQGGRTCVLWSASSELLLCVRNKVSKSRRA